MPSVQLSSFSNISTLHCNSPLCPKNINAPLKIASHGAALLPQTHSLALGTLYAAKSPEEFVLYYGTLSCSRSSVRSLCDPSQN